MERAQGRAEVKVAILAGGLGTRLGELARGLPKPMVPVGDRPFLELVIDSFSERGLRDLVLLIGYRGEVIENHFGDGSRFGVHIDYQHEREPLGTGGAVREARHLLGERFLLTYGDVLRRFDYDRFVREHPEPCLAVYRRISVGNTDIEGDRVIRFDKRAAELPYIDAGFCIMPSEVVDLLPERGSFEESVFPRLAAEGRLSCVIVGHDFFDVGTPEDLARARSALA